MSDDTMMTPPAAEPTTEGQQPQEAQPMPEEQPAQGDGQQQA